MTRDPSRNDDAAIEQLVRDAAGSWSMPPVRLDAPSWRDRIRSPRARRLAAAGGWFGRVGRAATAAITLTVAGALVAVLVTHPPQDAGKSPAPSAAAHATPLPKLLVTGDDPSPTVVVMRTERGDFARVDLSTGTINGPLTGKSSASQLRIDSLGSMLCLCVAESGSINGKPTDNTVTLERYDTRGKLQSSAPIDEFSGEPDPRDEGVFIAERPVHVQTEITFSADGKYGFVGWSLRAHPVWRSGIVVVDLAHGTITDRLAMPDATDGQGNARRVVGAPRVVGDIGGGAAAIAQGWYEWSPAASQNPLYDIQSDVFTADFDAGTFATLAPVVYASDCGTTVEHAGPLRNGGFWLGCTKGGAALTVVRRLAHDGSLLDDIRVSGQEGIDVDPLAVSPDGAALFTWDPGTTRLTRIDLTTGEQTSGKGVAVAATDPLAALGDWLAPSAAAKSFLEGALAISPDGSRVYAIGVRPAPGSAAMSDSSSTSGSSGVFVFDTSTLDPVAVWQPQADYVSIAVSDDGRFVYAAGLPGVDYAGRLKLEQQASITVIDAGDGSVRLVAGQLGGDMLSFIAPLIH